MVEKNESICHRCENYERKVSSFMGSEHNYERCSIDYLFLPDKYTCVGFKSR